MGSKALLYLWLLLMPAKDQPRLSPLAPDCCHRPSWVTSQLFTALWGTFFAVARHELNRDIWGSARASLDTSCLRGRHTHGRCTWMPQWYTVLENSVFCRYKHPTIKLPAARYRAQETTMLSDSDKHYFSNYKLYPLLKYQHAATKWNATVVIWEFEWGGRCYLFFLWNEENHNLWSENCNMPSQPTHNPNSPH